MASCNADALLHRIAAMAPAPARYYHTRLDRPEILVPGTIRKGIELALRAVFRFDERGFAKD